jgi:hypothetical protein
MYGGVGALYGGDECALVAIAAAAPA